MFWGARAALRGLAVAPAITHSRLELERRDHVAGDRRLFLACIPWGELYAGRVDLWLSHRQRAGGAADDCLAGSRTEANAQRLIVCSAICNSRCPLKHHAAIPSNFTLQPFA